MLIFCSVGERNPIDRWVERYQGFVRRGREIHAVTWVKIDDKYQSVEWAKQIK